MSFRILDDQHLMSASSKAPSGRARTREVKKRINVLSRQLDPFSEDPIGEQACWRKGTEEDWEQFFKNQYNAKLNCFKHERFVKLCEVMNIDTQTLMPKTLNDFLTHNGKPTGRPVDPNLAETRFNHYRMRRYQALAILSMRYQDLKCGDLFVSRHRYARNAAAGSSGAPASTKESLTVGEQKSLY